MSGYDAVEKVAAMLLAEGLAEALAEVVKVRSSGVFLRVDDGEVEIHGERADMMRRALARANMLSSLVERCSDADHSEIKPVAEGV